MSGVSRIVVEEFERYTAALVRKTGETRRMGGFGGENACAGVAKWSDLLKNGVLGCLLGEVAMRYALNFHDGIAEVNAAGPSVTAVGY